MTQRSIEAPIESFLQEQGFKLRVIEPGLYEVGIHPTSPNIIRSRPGCENVDWLGIVDVRNRTYQVVSYDYNQRLSDLARRITVEYNRMVLFGPKDRSN